MIDIHAQMWNMNPIARKKPEKQKLQNKKSQLPFFFIPDRKKNHESQDIHSLIYIVELKLQLFVLFLLS